MSALSAFVERLVFAFTCVMGWLVFPLLFLAGAIALLVYAILAECVSTLAGAARPLYRDRLAARRVADRLRGPLHR
jgi:hypothetical protein